MSKLTKRERDTAIYYDQSGDPMQIRTNDPKLIRRLKGLSEDYPELCKFKEDSEICGPTYEVDKRRITIQVTRPYSEERRRKQREWAKEHGLKGNQRQD